MTTIDAYTQQLATAFQSALTADCQGDQPAVQLMPEEIASLVALFQRSAAEVQPPAPVPAAKTKPAKKGRVRARSTYQIWKADPEVKAAFRLAHPGSDGPTTNKKMGEMWKALTDEEKTPFEALHEAELAEYASGAPKKENQNDETEKKEKKQPKKKKERKRARTGYMLYKGDEQVRKALREAHPEADFAAFSKLLSEQWKQLSDDEQQPYKDIAAAEKAEFEATKAMEEEKAALVAPLPVPALIKTTSAPTTLQTTPVQAEAEAEAVTALLQMKAPTEPSQEPASPAEPTQVASSLAEPTQVASSLAEPTQEPASQAPKKSRGSSPYQIYKKAHAKDLAAQHPEKEKQEITEMIQSNWQALSPEEKLPWETLAAQQKS